MRESFKDYYYTLNLNDSISLFEFEIYDVSNLELYCTIFFNWILFWFGLNLESQTNDYYLLIFMVEAFIYGILFFLSFFMYKNYKYKKSFVYRFCFLILLSSIFFSIFEAEWASVYRHKLFFIPVLLYLSNVNSFKKVILFDAIYINSKGGINLLKYFLKESEKNHLMYYLLLIVV